MFDGQMIDVAFKGLKFRVVQTDDGAQRVADAKFGMPLTALQALSFGSRIYNHIFEDTGAKSLPRPEWTEFGFNLEVGRQTMAMHPDRELTAAAHVKHVQLGEFRVTRPDPSKPRVVFEFMASFNMLDTKIAHVVTLFGAPIALQFTAEAPGFELSSIFARSDEAARKFRDTVAKSGGGSLSVIENGVVTSKVTIPDTSKKAKAAKTAKPGRARA